MNVSFTGTQAGLTSQQVTMLTRLIVNLRDTGTTFHHGDCIGADAQASVVVSQLTAWRIIAHPCDIDRKRAWTTAHEYRPVKKPLPRNRDLVKECDLLVACPGTMYEVLRSGTWATVRYAHEQGRAVCTVFPDGRLIVESLTALQASLVSTVVGA